MGTVLVLVTVADGAADEVSLQALTLGRQLAGGGPVHALLAGGATAAPSLGEWGATQVHVADHPALDGGAPDAHARVLDDLAASLGVDAVVGPGTEQGNTILARAAARAGLPFAANCTSASPGSPVTVTRIRWGGSLLEEAAIHADRAMLTVAPHTVAATQSGGTAIVSTFTPQLDEADLAVRVVGRIPAAQGGISLTEARVIVSGGRGVGFRGRLRAGRGAGRSAGGGGRLLPGRDHLGLALAHGPGGPDGDEDRPRPVHRVWHLAAPPSTWPAARPPRRSSRSTRTRRRRS